MKPWGPLSWLLPKLPNPGGGKVAVLGCLAAEERCVGVPIHMAAGIVSEVCLFDVVDPPSRFTETIAQKKAANRRCFEAEVGRGPIVTGASLFASDEEIVAPLDQLSETEIVDLYLDISCLPKRFFFLLVKLALRKPNIRTLVVTYTQPLAGGYTEEHLAEDPEGVAPLPGFGPSHQDPEQLIVGIGFEALGLPQLLGEYRDKKRDIVLLLPFPPGQPYSRRIWEMVRTIGHPGEGESIRRVSAVDAFGAYEELMRINTPIANSLRPPALAPYGPKPMSLGMCLYAIHCGCPVFYTQPRLYHPGYTTGIGDVWGYCLKLNGRETWPTVRSSAQ